MNKEEDLNRLINHLFLPPKLPQANDTTHDNRGVILRFVIDCCSAFVNKIERAETVVAKRWEGICAMLENMEKINRGTEVSPQTIRQALLNMEVDGMHNFINQRSYLLQLCFQTQSPFMFPLKMPESF